MPRDGSGIYHRPAGTDGVPNFPIESAKYNTYVADVEQDLNTPRPIVAGGTGATTAAGAITNLGGEQSHQLVTNYDAMAWVSGSFYSAAGATSAPTANAFSGIVYVTDVNNIVVEARDAATKVLYVRAMTAGSWSPWKIDGGVYTSDTAPPGAPDNSLWWETDSGILFVRYNDGSSTQWVPATPQQDLTTRVAKAGDTMTGLLMLFADPVAPLGAATKQYVDAGLGTLTTSTAGAVHYDAVQALTVPQKVQARGNIATPFRGWIAGLTLSTTGPSTSFAVTAGEAADSTSVDLMQLAAAIFKNTSSWTVGSGNGGLDTGALAINTWYHGYLIKRLDTGVVDVLFSLSATAPTMPASYTLFRRIGSMKTNASSQWTLFVQIGDEFLWNAPVQDVNGSGLNTVSTLFPLSVPPGVNVLARVRYQITTTSGTMGLVVQSPLIATVAPGSGMYISIVASGGGGGNGETTVMTDTSQQIRAVANASGGTQSTSFSTWGWTDTRGRFA